MQKLTNLIQAMQDTKLPWTYLQFGEGKAPPLPYLVYLLEGSNDLYADTCNYIPIQEISLELYTQEKSRKAEILVENCLRANEIRWSKSETYLDDEHAYEVIYSFELLIDDEVEGY